MHAPLIPKSHIDDFIIVRATAFASKVQRAMVRDVLRGEGLLVQEWRLLFSIARFGSCHLAYITRQTSIDPAHGSRAAAALEKRGLIVRTDDPQNRRRKIISLTPEGEVVFHRVWPRAQRRVLRITDQLSEEDFAALKRLLDLLNVAADMAPEGGDQGADATARTTGEDRIGA